MSSGPAATGEDKTTSEDQIEKQKPTPAGIRRKKQMVSVPLRRSERCKKQSSPNSQGSKAETSSGSPASHGKKRKKDTTVENSSIQSTSGTVEACEGEEDEMNSPEIKKVRMTAGAYKALFRKQEKKVKVSGQIEELDGSDKSSIKDGSNSGDHTEGAAAGEIGHITGDESLPDQEAVTVICEEESTQMRQKFDHNFQFRSSPKSVGMDRTDDPRRIGGISLSLDDDAHKNKVLNEQADAVAVDIDKDNTPILSTSGHEENNVGEASGMNVGRKSGEPEAGIYFKSCEKSAQLSNPSLDIQVNDSAVEAEQHSRCTAVGAKDNSSQFMEYWVPAQMSHVQLEQYCSTLVNSLPLRSSSRTDPLRAGALRDILTATRKCCDHPYLVDSKLQDVLKKDVQPTQIMDIGIQASGKLELLVKFLMEMRKRALRALILFQNIGRENDPITVGDILDDAVCHSFGEKSYERVDSGLARPTIQTAVDNFNNKELGRFVFLIEARACRSTIKLSSVDVVVIFGSDWQPANDIRNLQKMTLESESENIKVFRLYSCFTVEEKVLISSKKRVNMDVRVQDRTPSSCHMLLMWEATFLFNKLNEFHCSYSESSRLILSDPENNEDVIKELLSFLPVEENNLRSSSMVVRGENDGCCYHMDFPLYGESKSQLADIESLSPPEFWTKLLEGKHPRWKYLSGSSQRNRRRNIHLYGSDADEVGKKRKKLAINNAVQSPRKRGKGPSGSPPTPRQDLDNSERSLHQSLQHEISRICEVLNLGDEVKNMAQTFLDYVINNHYVPQEPATFFQAFQLALCWTAASILKVEVNHKESLQLVKTHMSYGCKKEANLVYTMMRDLKKTFLEQRSSDMGDVEDSSPDNSAEERIPNAIRKIKKEYGKRMEVLLQHQKENIDEVHKTFEAEKTTLENKRQIAADIIRVQYGEGPTRTEKLITLESSFAGKIEECKNRMTSCLNQLDRTHHASKTDLHLKEASAIKSVKEWAQIQLLEGANAQTGGGPNVAVDLDDPTDVNLSESGLGLSEVPCNADVSSACESSSVGLVDQDPHNCITADADGVNSSMASEEVPLDRLLDTASCANDKADQVTPLPNSEGVCSHSETVDAVSQNAQPLQSQIIPDTTIADEATEMLTVADDFTSVVEQDISGSPNDQASHSNEVGDSTPVQPLATFASAPTVHPEEPHDEPNGSCSPSTIASLIQQLNACAPVSSNSDATPPDQCDSEAADANLTPTVPDLSPVDAAAYSSLEGQNSMNFPPPGYASNPQSSFPSSQTSHLMSSVMGDPLQTEMENIQKVLDLIMKDHEDKKMELKKECEKEIDEVRCIFKAKEQKADELYNLKKKQVEAYQHQVRMSKVLATAFRSKCMDFRSPVARSQPGAVRNLHPQQMMLPQQHPQQMMLPQPNPASFPFTTSAPPSTLHKSPALSRAQTSTIRQSVNPQQLLHHNTPSIHASNSRPPPAMRQSVNPVQALPAQQPLHHNNTLIRASTTPRPLPPVTGQFTASVNAQLHPRKRAAPHMQPYRPKPPSVSPSSSNLPPQGGLKPGTYQPLVLPPSTPSSNRPDSVPGGPVLRPQQNPTPRAGVFPGVSPSTASHRPDSVAGGPVELLRAQQNPTPRGGVFPATYQAGGSAPSTVSYRPTSVPGGSVDLLRALQSLTSQGGVFPATYKAGGSAPSIASHRPDSVPGVPQKNSMQLPAQVSSSNTVEIRSRKENNAGAAVRVDSSQVDSSQVVCVSDDDN